MKTLGKVSASLIASLYDDNKTIFTVDDVVRRQKSSRQTAIKLIYDLIKRKIVSRLKKGKYILIPQELGSTEKYIGDWFIAAREIANSRRYYVGFYSAMKYWGMTTQPVLKMFIVSPKRQSIPKTMIGKISFVFVNKKHIWGAREEWVTKTDKVRISDLEKTILDAFAHPEYCGGITEIAKGMWIVKDKINFSRLKNYIHRYNKNVVAKRLGYTLELLNIEKNDIRLDLEKFVKNRYDLFDPTLSRKVINKNNWKLIDNVGKENILKIVSY